MMERQNRLVPRVIHFSFQQMTRKIADFFRFFSKLNQR